MGDGVEESSVAELFSLFKATAKDETVTFVQWINNAEVRSFTGPMILCSSARQVHMYASGCHAQNPQVQDRVRSRLMPAFWQLIRDLSLRWLVDDIVSPPKAAPVVSTSREKCGDRGRGGGGGSSSRKDKHRTQRSSGETR